MDPEITSKLYGLDFPILVGITNPGTNIHVVRPLTDDEKRKLTEYTKVLAIARSRFKLFAILRGNYKQWADYITSLLKPGGDLTDSEMIELDRLLLNFLSSAKSVLEHFKQHWTQAHRNTPREKEFKTYVEKLESGSWAFAFFQDLRNFTQHCGLPVGKYSRSHSGTSVTLSIGCDAGWLADNYKNWDKSKLTKAHGHIDYVVQTREYFVRLQQDFGKFVAKEFGPRLIEAHNFFAKLANEVAAAAPDAEFRLLTEYRVIGDDVHCEFSTPPSDILKSLGLVATPEKHERQLT